MVRIGRLAVVALAAALAGCAIDDSGPVRSVWRTEGGRPTWINVVYVTDRQPDASFPGGFATRWAGAPSCGTATTVIPSAMLAGEKPQYGYVEKTAPLSCAGAGGRLAGAIALIEEQAKARHCRSVFLFVHGFHTGFDGAVLRAAQVSHDAETGCAVAAFSWSAEIDVDRYVSDLEHSDYSGPLLAEFLRELDESGLRVTVEGHSLGSRLLLMTLSSLGQSRLPPRAGFIDELVLTAPDVGADPRNNDFAKLMDAAAAFAKRTTIYVSSLDSVLEISRREHGGVPRLGNETDFSFRPAETDHEVDIIDATDAPADRLDHSYYAMSPETVADIMQVLKGVALQDRLKAAKPTLACGMDCPPDYRLNLPEGRGPRFVTRFIMHALPVIPLVR